MGGVLDLLRPAKAPRHPEIVVFALLYLVHPYVAGVAAMPRF